jgi:polysaccharide export outer membrane protein
MDPDHPEPMRSEKMHRPQEPAHNGARRGSVALTYGGFFAIIALLAFSGCQTGSTGPYPKEWASQTPGAIAPGDVIKLSFPGAPELNQLQKVRPDGKISLPTFGEMQVAGKRLGELQKELSRKYESEIKNSEVVVTLEFSAIPVYVTGTVKGGGKIVLDRPMTALEAILEAGGFGDFANTKKVVVIRNVNGRHMTYVLDLSPSLRGKPTEAFYLKAYDAIYVP